MNKIILLIGAPGAGKGTQARLLEERLGLPQISTGDIFRALAKADTPLARQIKGIQAAGQLVPDELTIRVVEERTIQDDCRDGYILDGFPRTTGQADKLEDLAKSQGKELQAILVDVPLDLLEKRLTGRRSCPVCGEIYNIYFKPPKNDNVCDLHPETGLDLREDDKEEKVRARFEVYLNQTQPLLDYYDTSDRLERVDGTQEPEKVYQDLENLIRAV
ncbi:MAG TPA: adenylate kinase [Pyrinomonadaceae bacterium]|nr:adenylate kinase [Pyrinomonadaceae bacterium]